MGEWTGYAKLEVAKQNGRTIIVPGKFHYGSFKVTHPLYLDDDCQATLYLLSTGGGYVNGDAYRLELHAREGSIVSLRNQGATKIYRTIDTPPIQENRMFLEKGSFASFIPEPTILYKDARFYQKTEISMEKGATLFLAEILTPGWSPDGEFFSYKEYRSEVKIFYEGQMAVLDRLRLLPEEDFSRIGYLDSYTHYGSLFVISDSLHSDMKEIIKKSLEAQKSFAKIGISALPYIEGVCIRILANNTGIVEEIITSVYKLLQNTLKQIQTVQRIG
ncbi:urease accessory protein UreD [Bacillus sp. V5-8f]|uniref:urease accessory protein UreD n=1 Tax=Bacillus sp. V5-8f TaxID=2053044 RepID=UPI000C75D3E9|nr:urease accessory protein UreD [Bacillus sp. V5-8f]PLT33073.1 urease accessory protein [Bacillus sp. V5-8f]